MRWKGLAAGAPLVHPAGHTMQLRRPLDFQAVTDHGILLGVLPAMGGDLLADGERAPKLLLWASGDPPRCPDNGAAVDLSDCSFSQDLGAAELRTVFEDPGFQPGQRAVYYLRVLENPTCRWSTWDAIRAGVEPRAGVPPTIQERAWSSPIWYRP